jgi:hypothetical protein
VEVEAAVINEEHEIIYTKFAAPSLDAQISKRSFSLEVGIPDEYIADNQNVQSADWYTRSG